MATVPQMRAYLVDKAASRPTHLVLDLSGVTFLASLSIAVLRPILAGRLAAALVSASRRSAS